MTLIQKLEALKSPFDDSYVLKSDVLKIVREHGAEVSGDMLRLIIANDVLIKNMRHRDARWHDDPDVLKVLQSNTEVIKAAGYRVVRD